MTLCQVCQSEPFKYRCPDCSTQSCSLACSQTHKSNCTPKPSAAEPEELASNGIPVVASGDGTNVISRQPNGSGFAQKSQEIQQLLADNPGLRSRLHGIYTSTLEESWEETRPRFHSRGRGRGRDGRGQRSLYNAGPWTAEKGFNKGVKRVRQWKDSCEAGAHSADAAAFMRFTALVLGEDRTESDQPQLEGFT